METMTARRGDWIQTPGTGRFWPLDPRPEDIDLIGLAHTLAQECRYSAMTVEHYSVAQHSVLVSQLCDPADALEGLFHDAPEALGLRDFARPVKNCMPPLVRAWFKSVEWKIWKALARKYGLGEQKPPSVARADDAIVSAEMLYAMGGAHPEARHQPSNGYPLVVPEFRLLPAAEAKHVWLDRFDQLRPGVLHYDAVAAKWSYL